jgi:hypothetical protein
MATRDDELRIRPGRIQDGNRGAKRPKTFVGEVMRAAKRAGHTGKSSTARVDARDVRPLVAAVARPCLCRRVRRGGELSS